MEYYVIFSLATLIVGLGEFFLKKTNKFIGILMFFLALIILSVFAAFRDFSVGVDILVYGNRQFYNFSLFDNFTSIFTYSNVSTEIGYVFINWLISRFTQNVRIFYFFLSFIFSLFCFLGIYKLKDKMSITFSFFLYLLTTWYLSLNLLRQSIAMGIIFLAIAYFVKNETKKSIFISFFAIFFHYSSIFILLLLISLIIFDKVNISSNKKICLVIFFVCLILIFAGNLIEFIQNFNFDNINERYTEYSENAFTGGRVVNLFALVRFFFPTILVLMITYRNSVLKKYNTAYVLIIFGMLISTISTIQGFNYIVFGRLSYYLLFGYVYTVPIIIRFEHNKYYKLMYSTLIIFWAIAYFYLHVFVSEYGGLYPFKFY